MIRKSNKRGSISRRKILHFLGSGILFSLFGFGNSIEESTSAISDEKYQTLLKSDGTAVKVKISTIKKAKIIQNKISNKTFLNWLGRKL